MQNAAAGARPELHPAPQVLILDAGGQYCHLIARKVRELGVYAEVRPSRTPAAELAGAKGVIISGGPASVYEPASPKIDPALLSSGLPVLGICYGQQLMAQILGGKVRRGEKGEYGLATLERAGEGGELLEGVEDCQQIWMSHRDTVAELPAGFSVVGRTAACAVAAMAAPGRRLYGLQFHPEVVHTLPGQRILANFVLRICGCQPDWNPRSRIPAIEREVRRVAGGRNVFFFVSGGVDSTVAFTLCVRALGRDRVRGVYVDTGLMREGETGFVRQVFEGLAPGAAAIEDAGPEFLARLEGVRDPEAKRRIIGEEFVRVQERILASRKLLDSHWILGQGTIYPDTIESGGSENAAVIKTHHNRVEGIQRLIEAGRIVEPLSSFYKDEVREIGRELGLPEELLSRHPFPGPGLAIRCLCAEQEAQPERVEEGWIVPLRSVGVQGDSRTYARVLAANRMSHDEATAAVNRVAGINRVIRLAGSRVPLDQMRVFPSALSRERLALLRRADAIVRAASHRSGFDQRVWQFPVVLIPFGAPAAPESIVLRPVESVDGMTAQSALMDEALLRSLTEELLSLEPVCGVFYDLTHKPPGTIEWE
ncbi:MAG: glutamine-hydrolyzing GMP synthase [Acidobacteria bacterium]|nr:glutamine-hydrolyzing GMP synthase [Acidobacteriota bacterium]